MKVYSYREIIKILRKNGFILTRTHGSHETYSHVDGRKITIKYNSVNRMIWQRLVKENRLEVMF